MTVLVQMPKEEYDALKARADRTDEEVRKKVAKVFDALLFRMRQNPSIAFPTFIDFMEQRKDKFIAGTLHDLGIDS